ncbi:hypothetical protein ACVWXM_006588 [Bradyrhizobium sp. GM7.3]
MKARVKLITSRANTPCVATHTVDNKSARGSRHSIEPHQP